jgi:hypothetical protein
MVCIGAIGHTSGILAAKRHFLAFVENKHALLRLLISRVLGIASLWGQFLHYCLITIRKKTDVVDALKYLQ